METLSRDEQILSMKSKIEKKKQELNTKASFRTKCSITLRGYTYNLHVLSVSQLQVLKIDIEQLLKYMIEYESINLFLFLEDINTKINLKSADKLRLELEEMEKELTSLLSKDYKEAEKFNSILSKLSNL